nr:MAG: nonstructural protein [Army ant associated chapparvovirus 6]
MYKRNPKAYFAMREKLRKAGKWKVTDKASNKKEDQPSTSATDNPEPGELFSTCLTPSMFDIDNGIGKEEFVPMHTSATGSGQRKERQNPTPVSDISESEDECEDSISKKECLINHTVLCQNRDTQKAAREVERCIRNREDCLGHYSGRARRVLGGTNTMDSRIILMGPKEEYDILVVDSYTFAENTPVLSESGYDETIGYFQTYNSLAIVIRTLPDTTIYTMDIINYMEEIKDPYILICEKSDSNVWHWHMIWFTDKRSDNAKRTLMGLFNPKGPGKSLARTKLSVSVQQTKSFKHLLKYILKQPVFICVRNDENLWKVACSQYKTGDSPVIVDSEIFPNVMVREIIGVMRTHLKYTMEELMLAAPEIMRKYLHKSNVDSIIQNCRMYLLAPTDIDTLYKRITSITLDFYCFFHLYCYLFYQEISPNKFLLKLFKVLFMDMDKHNTFVVQGPSNTGKTSFFHGLLKYYNWGEVQSSGQFMFQNCINKELLIWEEPLIGHDFVENVKKVFEGMATQVSVKYKPAQTLYRTPVIITTNKDLWHYCEGDEQALKNRCFLYYFRKSAGGYGRWIEQYYQQCRRRYKQFIAGLGSAISTSLTGPGCGPEFDQSTASSCDSSDYESGNTDWKQLRSDDHSYGKYNQQLYNSAGDKFLRWWNDNGRIGGRECPDFECTESERSSSGDCSSTDDQWLRSDPATGNSPLKRGHSDARRGSSTKKHRRLPSGNSSGKLHGHRRGNTRSGIGRGNKSVQGCSQYIYELYNRQFGRGKLIKIQESTSITNEPRLGWVLDTAGAVTENDWLSVIRLMWDFHNGARAVSYM